MRTPTSMRPLRSASPLLALTLGIGACFGGWGVDNPFLEEDAGPRTLGLRVENRSFNDATLHALSVGTRIRVGRVGGKQTQSFTIPWDSRNELRVEIDLLAGGEHTTNAVTAGPGEEVHLVIQANLRRSFIRR